MISLVRLGGDTVNIYCKGNVVRIEYDKDAYIVDITDQDMVHIYKFAEIMNNNRHIHKLKTDNVFNDSDSVINVVESFSKVYKRIKEELYRVLSIPSRNTAVNVWGDNRGDNYIYFIIKRLVNNSSYVRLGIEIENHIEKVHCKVHSDRVLFSTAETGAILSISPYSRLPGFSYRFSKKAIKFHDEFMIHIKSEVDAIRGGDIPIRVEQISDTRVGTYISESITNMISNYKYPEITHIPDDE